VMLRRMFSDFRLFRLIVDEVEKTLLQVDLDIAREYGSLVEDPGARNLVFGLLEQEHALTTRLLLEVSGAREIGARFAGLRGRLARKLPSIAHANRHQIELLRRYRSAGSEVEREPYKAPLLLSINCIASGFGSTG
jgi:phosphoenolpyruvate carboxylase